MGLVRFLLYLEGVVIVNEIWQHKGLRYFLLLYLAFYIIVGAGAALYISDFDDAPRGYFYSFFAIPAAVLFFFVVLSHPDFVEQSPRLFLGWLVILVLSFSWGNILFLNAMSDSRPVVVNLTIKEDPYTFNYRQGGFGWLYRYRF